MKVRPGAILAVHSGQFDFNSAGGGKNWRALVIADTHREPVYIYFRATIAKDFAKQLSGLSSRGHNVAQLGTVGIHGSLGVENIEKVAWHVATSLITWRPASAQQDHGGSGKSTKRIKPV